LCLAAYSEEPGKQGVCSIRQVQSRLQLEWCRADQIPAIISLSDRSRDLTSSCWRSKSFWNKKGLAGFEPGRRELIWRKFDFQFLELRYLLGARVWKRCGI